MILIFLDEGTAQQMNVKLPWELKSVYLGALWDNGLIEEEEEDEEMTEARQDRLRVCGRRCCGFVY